MNTATAKVVWVKIKLALCLTAWKRLSLITDVLLRVESRLVSRINDLPISIEKSFDEVVTFDDSEIWSLESPSAFASTSPPDSNLAK